MKNESQTTPNSPSALKALFLASRPRTWIAGLAPVLMGTAFSPTRLPSLFFFTLLFSLCIQIGANFANDYFDFIKGADTKERKGPKRAALEGWLAPQTLLISAFASLCLALLFALPLMIRAGWWSFPLALLCTLLAILYTGGPKPLGYLGLGELFVLLFFGPIAFAGTYYLQTLTLPLGALLAGLSPGLLSCSILIANNLRDEATDRSAHKNTLVVRFGRTFGLYEYGSTLLLATLIPLLLVLFFEAPTSLLSLCLLPLLAYPILKKAPSLLEGSALLLLIYTALFCLVYF